MERSPHATIDLEDLGFDSGARLLIERALGPLPHGARLAIRGRHADLPVHLRAWARSAGHALHWPGAGGGQTPRESPAVVTVERGSADLGRWRSGTRAGAPDPSGVVDRPGETWGVAARGALVEEGGPPVRFGLDQRDLVWVDAAPRLYAQAAAAQWDPDAAIDWGQPVDVPEEVEDAVVTLMTYLIENEQTALVVPAQFLGRIHPHYREVVQFLATQVADEARHVEVFTRRALLRRQELGVSGAGGRASLATLLEEPDFALASFLLSVLGEGTFLNLLGFVERHAPDPITQRIAHLVLRDEARHVAFGVAHLRHRVQGDPALKGRLRVATRRRHDALLDTAGLHAGVRDALAILAAGSWQPAAIAAGYQSVQDLGAEMDEGRRRRLLAIGFGGDEAADLSALHTRNFM